VASSRSHIELWRNRIVLFQFRSPEDSHCFLPQRRSALLRITWCEPADSPLQEGRV
jgi:hypothetical protein